MDEICKDVNNIENLTKNIDEIKNKSNDIDKRLLNVEKDTAVKEEQIKMLFTILGEIKDSIKKIDNKIDEIESNPRKLLYSIAGGIIVAIMLIGLKYI